MRKASYKTTRWFAAPFDQIRCNDGRLIPIARQTLHAHGNLPIADAIRRDRDAAYRLNPHYQTLALWAHQVASSTLDSLAGELLDAWEQQRLIAGQQRGRRRRGVARRPLPQLRPAVIARLGLDGQPPVSCRLAGKRAGCSGERVRQYTAEIEQAAHTWIWAPALDRAIALADGTLTTDQYTQMLLDEGLTGRPWHPDAVASLAALCGRHADIRVADDPALEEQRIRKATADSALALIKERDIISLPDLTDALAETVPHASPDQIKIAVESSPSLQAAWPWITSSSTAHVGRLHRAVTGMLAIAGNLPAKTLHTGLQRRRSRTTLSHPLPGPHALTALLHADAAFTAETGPDNTDTFRLSEPLTLDQVYEPTSCVGLLIAHIQRTPGNVCTRPQLLQVALDHGYTSHSVDAITTNHEAFVRVGLSLSTLVGYDPDPDVIAEATEAWRGAISEQVQTCDGKLFWTFTVTPGLRRQRLIERHTLATYAGEYRLDGQQDCQCAAIQVHPTGKANLRTYLRHHRHPDGARLTLILDPEHRTAAITSTSDDQPVACTPPPKASNSVVASHRIPPLRTTAAPKPDTPIRPKPATVPALTTEQRRAALAKANQARRARAHLLRQLKQREIALPQLFARDDNPVVGKIRISTLLEAMPQCGPAAAAKIIDELGIARSRRVKGLGSQQRAALLQAFERPQHRRTGAKA